MSFSFNEKPNTKRRFAVHGIAAGIIILFICLFPAILCSIAQFLLHR